MSTTDNPTASSKAAKKDIDAFLHTVADLPPPRAGSDKGRLIFALDATASRQRTWAQATALQKDMFLQTRGIGELNVQLAYYRGYGECQASQWQSDPLSLVALMNKVSCVAGRTQIARILKHGISETKIKPVQALVFVGDCCEEDVDALGDLAGQLKILGLPVFIFQEGFDAHAHAVFSQIARLSGGAHCRFDQNASAQLGQLLNAVAAYAAGGRDALVRLKSTGSQSAAQLLAQLS
ncbi:MAG: VWA domain-containing protein [Gammaproteobacteria bacterium]|nr:VWA domain-containing protein [Gammaproteobacteria bacterium]